MSTSVLSIRVDADIKERLDALSRATGRPAAFYVRQALLERLDDLEWAYDVARRAEAIRAGDDATAPLDALARDLGFEPDGLKEEAHSGNLDTDR
ncbi:type II toxin-antitoxin system RelB family antitoxin [Tessaracoccus palaemonis]|uniref:Ribbon-helix-helix domain-containing protein n=1 Tax=Tessaracoccus palaemonis TaxID=2829499 RepID=A0ABX8SKQ9_9ACTN|nr:ribbon-helix-helix domain-containing protein [Tessaracoccus palaemonis]QXT63015.1 ribbon-helix-helix domain-containing protein [Tessaracoccus palaemonis]